MNCPTCSTALETGQKFCIQCGTNVAALTLPAPPAGPVGLSPPTTAITSTPPSAGSSAAPTVAAPLLPLPPRETPIPDDPQSPDLPTDGPFAIVEQTNQQQTSRAEPASPQFAAPPFDGAASWTGESPLAKDTKTGMQPVLGTAATPFTIVPATDVLDIPGRGSMLLAALAGVAGIALVIGCFFPLLTISSDGPIADVGDYKINDFLMLGTGLLVGFVVAAICMVGGGFLATQGKRIGAGIAAGAALTVIPVAIVVWGTVDLVSKQAEQNAFAVAAAGGGGTFFRSKQNVGLFVVLGAAVVGIVALIVATIQAGNDGRPRLNLAVSVAGAMASLLAVLGQMIPGDGRSFSDNFDTDFLNAAIVYGRLALIIVVAGLGIVGFLRSNRWGIGLAIGGASIWVWQWLSSIAELGDMPAPPGWFALGNDIKPHVVTTIGVIAMLVLAIVAIMTAPKQPTETPLP